MTMTVWKDAVDQVGMPTLLRLTSLGRIDSNKVLVYGDFRGLSRKLQQSRIKGVSRGRTF